MNPKMVILGILMFTLLFFLYRWLLGTETAVITNLKYDTALSPYSFSALSIPNSTRYCYYIWIYVNKIDPALDENIFTVYDSTLTTHNSGNLLKLYIRNTTQLYLDLVTNNNGTSAVTSNLMTSNFPLQSWQQVIISFDNTNLDFYHNGKFIKSQNFINTNLPVKTTTSTVVKFGTNTPDINIKLFDRLDYPMDPQTAWNKYLHDLKTSSGTGMVNYGLNLNLSTNNKVSTPIKLF